MMKNRYLIFILVFVLSISLIACSSNGAKPDTVPGPVDSSPAATAIEQRPADIDKDFDLWSGIFIWSPDSAYAIFHTMSSKADKNAVLLLDVKNNKLTKLMDGRLTPSISWSKDSKQVVFNADEQLYLYNILDKTLDKVADKGYMPQFSPDGTKFIYMNDGLWIYNIASKSSSQITKGKYDTAPIWFSDSKRVFYFRDNGKNLGDGAGNEQVMSILDTSAANKISDVDVDMKGKFRLARWLKEDQKLLIFAGWDDGHFYHVLNLDNNELLKNVVAEGSIINSFDDLDKKILISKDFFTTDMVEAYDYDMKKLGVYSIDNDKDYPAASDNIGITALKDNRMIYLHMNKQEYKGELMISYLADGKQTRVTDYGSYSEPIVSPNKELVAYFEGGKQLKVVPIDNLKETEITRVESEKKAFNELLRMLPDRVGTEWKYNGFAEYGHSMRIDGINAVGENKTEYLISGKVDDMSDGEAKGDFSIYLKYLITKDGIKETITKGEKLPHRIKEMVVLKYPLVKGNTWTQQVQINNQSVELNAEIIEVSLNKENNKVLKVQYTAKVKGMPNDTYKEVRTYEEGKGITAFENTFDKDIDFNYSLYQFNK